jgi:hypothetical protein
VAACFVWFFPWVSPLLPFNHPTMDDEYSPQPAVSQSATAPPDDLLDDAPSPAVETPAAETPAAETQGAETQGAETTDEGVSPAEG